MNNGYCAETHRCCSCLCAGTPPALTVEERAYARTWLAARGVRRDWEEIGRYKEVRQRRERPFRLLSWHLCWIVTEDHWYPARSSTPIRVAWVSSFAFCWSQLLSVCAFNLVSTSVAQTNWTNFSTCTSHSLKFYWKWFSSCPASPPEPHQGWVLYSRFLLRLIIKVYTQWLTLITDTDWSIMTQTDRHKSSSKSIVHHQIKSSLPHIFYCGFLLL